MKTTRPPDGTLRDAKAFVDQTLGLTENPSKGRKANRDDYEGFDGKRQNT